MRCSATTLEYKVNLLTPATPDTSPVTARARVVKRTGSIAVASMDVVDRTGTLCSTSIGTYRIFRGKVTQPIKKLIEEKKKAGSPKKKKGKS